MLPVFPKAWDWEQLMWAVNTAWLEPSGWGTDGGGCHSTVELEPRCSSRAEGRLGHWSSCLHWGLAALCTHCLAVPILFPEGIAELLLEVQKSREVKTSNCPRDRRSLLHTADFWIQGLKICLVTEVLCDMAFKRPEVCSRIQLHLLHPSAAYYMGCISASVPFFPPWTIVPSARIFLYSGCSNEQLSLCPPYVISL